MNVSCFPSFPSQCHDTQSEVRAHHKKGQMSQGARLKYMVLLICDHMKRETM